MYHAPRVAYPSVEPAQNSVDAEAKGADQEDGPQKAQRLAIHGDEHAMNLPPSLHLNIQQSTFFKGL